MTPLKLGDQIDVLDNGFVRLVDVMGSDAAIVQAARVSYGEGTKSVHDDRGLIPAILQDATTGDVLMVAWMNEEALQLTQETGEAHFWSRSRQVLWHKGGTSGNVQRVREMWVDCDADVLLLKVDPAGAACHTGEQSCFFRQLT